MTDVTRRGVIVGSGAALAVAVLGAATAEARSESASGPHLDAFAITADRVAVVARIPSGQTVTVRQGSSGVWREVADDGVTVVGVPVAKNATSRITVEGPSFTRTFTVDTRAEALRESVLRVVNKRIALTEEDVPAKLVAVGGVMLEARLESPLKRMIAAAKKDDIDLEAVSGYRSFSYQKSVYGRYEKRDGRKAADTYSARPGHSEHQLGLTLDVRGADGEHELEAAFKNTPTGRWVAAHAHEFGFIVRYQEGQEKVTGYRPEPWHLRFVGADVARFLAARDDIATLEALFGLPDAPGY